MFTNIKNGQLSKKLFVLQPKKKLCSQFLNVLWDEGLILGYRTYHKNSKMIIIFLKYNKHKSCISDTVLISKPGKRIYYSVKQLWKIESNVGILILSTNKGILSLQKCKQLNIGGEPFVFLN
mgnify:FL=1|jgi:small subunit ribosomal protein S8